MPFKVDVDEEDVFAQNFIKFTNAGNISFISVKKAQYNSSLIALLQRF